MNDLSGRPASAFVSYSHDSPEHAAAALALANRLREDGIDCDIDQHHMAPAEGWPAWMDRGIRESDFVLVVCSKPYFDRVTGRAPRGVGLGAKWEGAIIGQEIYEAEGRNDKFLPLVLDPSNLEFRPPFLRPTTYYDLSHTNGYENLYRRLTRQPKVTKPELGAVKPLPHEPPAAQKAPQPGRPVDSDSLLALYGDRGQLVIYEAHEIKSGDEVEIVLSTLNPPDASLLRNLRKAHNARIGISYGNTAFLGRVRQVEEIVLQGKEKWRLTIAPEETDYGSGIMEMGTSTHSADEIAAMRARRILLNEPFSATPFGDRGHTDRAFMEVLIRGHSSPITVPESPLPRVYQTLQSNPEFFVPVARLIAIMWLRLSGVIAHVHRLDLAVEADHHLRVDFEGQRPRKYTNEDPPIIRVSGAFDLTKVVSND